MEIKVKFFVEDLDPLCYVDEKSDWIDLHAAETVTMRAGEYRLIPLGVAGGLRGPYHAPELHLQELRDFADQLPGGGGLLLLRGRGPVVYARLRHPGRDH